MRGLIREGNGFQGLFADPFRIEYQRLPRAHRQAGAMLFFFDFGNYFKMIRLAWLRRLSS